MHSACTLKIKTVNSIYFIITVNVICGHKCRMCSYEYQIVYCELSETRVYFYFLFVTISVYSELRTIKRMLGNVKPSTLSLS